MEDYETTFKDLGNVLSKADFYDLVLEEDYDMHLHFAKEKMQLSSEEIAKNAQKFMFAEDFVSFVAEFHRLIYSKKDLKDSEMITILFTETLKQAVRVIREEVNNIKCKFLQITEEKCKSCKYFYESFVNSVLSHYSEKSLKAGTFLYLCVYFSELASKCYSPYSEGILDLAVYAIIDAFCMFKGETSELNDYALTVINKSGYICPLPSSLCIGQRVLFEKDQKYKNPSFSEYFCEQNDQLEERESGLEQPKTTANSDKHFDDNSLEFDIGENTNRHDIEENRAILHQLKLAKQSNAHKREDVNKLYSAMNKSTENNKENDDYYRDALKHLKPEDKTEKYESTSNLNLDKNENVESNEENEIEEYKSALGQLKDKPYQDSLEFAIETIANNSPQNEFLKLGRAIFEDLKLKDESFTDNCEFTLDEILKHIYRNEFEKCEDVLEQIINKLEYSTFKSRKLAESLRCVINDTTFSFCDEKYLISAMLETNEKLVFPLLATVFGDFVHEVMSVVFYEAVVLSQDYLVQKYNPKLDYETKHSQNEKENVESTRGLSSQSIHVKDSSFTFEQIQFLDLGRNKDKFPIHKSVASTSSSKQGLEKESHDFSITLEHEDVKTLNDESKELNFEQNKFIIQCLTDNKEIISSMDYCATQVELESKTNDSRVNVDTVQNNVIESEIKSSAEDSIASVLVFKQPKNEKSSCDTSEYKDENFPNSESTDMDISGETLLPPKPAETDTYLNMHDAGNLTEIEVPDLTLPYDPTLPDGKRIEAIFTAYKRAGDADDNIKYLKIDSFLFAIDLIRYVAKEFYGITYKEPCFDEFRPFSCNAFNDSTKETALFIHDEIKTINQTAFVSMQNIKLYYTDYYRKYTDAVLSHYSDDGSSSDAFLYCSLHFSELASELYLADQPRCLQLALYSILDAFCLLKDDWNEFNDTIEKVLNFYKSSEPKQCKSYCTFNFRCVKTILDTITSLNMKVAEISYKNCVNSCAIVLSQTAELSKILKQTGALTDVKK